MVIGLVLLVGISSYNYFGENDVSNVPSVQEKILEEFGNVGYEKGTLSNGEKKVEYKGALEEYCEGGNC